MPATNDSNNTDNNHPTDAPDCTMSVHTEAMVIENSTGGAVYLAAFERCRDLMAALDPKKLLVPNLDVAATFIAFRGVLPLVLAMRDRIIATLNDFDIKNLDNLADYFGALVYANGVWVATIQEPKDLPEVQARAVVLRDALYSDARGLVIRGLIAADSLKDIKNKVGYRAVLADLTALVPMFRGPWGALAPRTGRAARELDEADAITVRIADLVGGRTASPEVVARVTDDRQRAYTLALRAYEKVRRAVIYLCGEESDPDKICPSLYAGRGAGNRKKTDAPADGTDPTDPSVTAPETPATSTATAPVSAPQAAPAVMAEGSGLSNASAVGMPGSNPFVG